jgi:hypothetical protein
MNSVQIRQFNAQLYQFDVVLKGYRARHWVNQYLVVGESAGHARARLLERLIESDVEFKHVDEGREMGVVQYVSSRSIPNADAQKRMGIAPAVPKPKPKPKPSKRVLGLTQRSVLRGLVEHKGWHDNGCGWVWNNVSGTQRILDSLVQRCLVDKGDHKYTINEAGIKALKVRRP